VRQVERVNIAEVVEHAGQLGGHALDLGLGQIETGQTRDFGDSLPRNRLRHEE